MWGIQETEATFDGAGPPNHAAVLGVGAEVAELALPVASKPSEVPPPCPEVPISGPGLRDLVGSNGRLLRCDERPRGRIEWPRYTCYRIDKQTVARVVPGAPDGDHIVCAPAPQPTVSRVLVVDGRPILVTDQTLEALDPETFASTQIAHHPSGPSDLYR